MTIMKPLQSQPLREAAHALRKGESPSEIADIIDAVATHMDNAEMSMTAHDPIADLEATARALAEGHDPAEVAVRLHGIAERLRRSEKELTSVLLGTYENGPHRWRRDCEIVVDYMPPFPRPETLPRCVVRCGESFLRYSKGPVQGYSWDCYGDDMHCREWAMVALSKAPVPPHLLRR
jgi:hypothetical protein